MLPCSVPRRPSGGRSAVLILALCLGSSDGPPPRTNRGGGKFAKLVGEQVATPPVRTFVVVLRHAQLRCSSAPRAGLLLAHRRCPCCCGASLRGSSTTADDAPASAPAAAAAAAAAAATRTRRALPCRSSCDIALTAARGRGQRRRGSRRRRVRRDAVHPRRRRPTRTARPPRMAELFSSNCAGCHTGGGNVVEPAQTLRSDGARCSAAATPAAATPAGRKPRSRACTCTVSPPRRRVSRRPAHRSVGAQRPHRRWCGACDHLRRQA